MRSKSFRPLASQSPWHDSQVAPNHLHRAPGGPKSHGETPSPPSWCPCHRGHRRAHHQMAPHSFPTPHKLLTGTRGSPETQRMRWCVGSAKVECESHPSWRERRRPVRDISRTFPPDERPMLAHPQIHPGGRHDPLKAPALVSGPPVPSRCSLALWGLTSPSSRCPWKKASFAANPFERPVSSHPPP